MLTAIQPRTQFAEQSRHDRHRDCRMRREQVAVVPPVRYRVVAIRTATGRILVNRPLSPPR
jgi:hypothetical protein